MYGKYWCGILEIKPQKPWSTAYHKNNDSGKKFQNALRKWNIRLGNVSDANPAIKSRSPILSEARDAIRTPHSEELANVLCVTARVAQQCHTREDALSAKVLCVRFLKG